MITTQKIRQSMPETNSSSSHSLVICKNNDNRSKLNLPLNQDDNVVIPRHEDFGWGWELSFDPGVRACYVISCICTLFSTGTKGFNEHKSKFEKVIKDYTGAKNVLYEWAPKNTLKQIKDLSPSVDHQSVSDMYGIISITEDSMRDFIFSNQSYLIIGGEECTPYNILTTENSNIDYKVKIILETESESLIGVDTVINFIEWPGGNKIREVLEDISDNFYFSTMKNSFDLDTSSTYWLGADRGKEGYDYTSSKCYYLENEIRYFKKERDENNFFHAPINPDEIEDYKTIKFRIERYD